MMLALRLARRDLQGASGGFWILVAGITFAVAAIAAVGSIADAVLDGVRAGARESIGGDLSLRLFHRPANPAERAFFAAAGAYSEVAELRPLARRDDGTRSTLVELKAVDDAYPLYGQVTLDPPLALDAALAERNRVWGAAVDHALLAEMAVVIGDRLLIGAAEVEIRALVKDEPERALRAFSLGPRVIIAREALDESGLIEPGAPIYWYNRIRLSAGADPEPIIDDIEARFPDAGWRIVDAADGIPGVERTVEIGRTLFILVGLSVLLISGVGISGAVSAHLERKTSTIAVLKTLGARRTMVLATYLGQVATASVLATLAGLAAGALVQFLAMRAAAPWLPFAWRPGVQPIALAVAAAFGLLAALLFALWPLERACSTRPSALFRNLVARERVRPNLLPVIAAALAACLIAALVIGATAMPLLSALFAAGAASAVIAFIALGRAVAWTANRWRGLCPPLWHLALANVARPGAPTVPFIMALGLTLTLLVAIVTVERIARSRLTEVLPREVPELLFINIAPAEAARFEAVVAGVAGVERVRRMPFLHGRITRVQGIPVRDWQVPRDVAWVVRGDRGLSWAASPPPGSLIEAGAWWPADYAGATLASLDARVAERLRLGVGDRLTLNVLGEPLQVEIANLRRLEWTGIDIDFPIVLSPPAVAPPHTEVAAVWMTDGAPAAVEDAVAELFSVSPPIRVPDVLEAIAGMAEGVATALLLASGATAVAALFVLLGTVAAGYRRRVEEMALLRVLGARPRQIALICAIEFGLTAAVAGVLAGLLGTAAAYAIVSRLMPGSWVFLPATPALITVALIASLAAAGYLLLRRASTRPPARLCEW